MPTLLRYPPVPVRTKPRPIAPKASLIDWPIVAAAGTCAVILLAGTLVAAWFATRSASTPKERSVPLAEAPPQGETPPAANQVDGPAVALPASAADDGAKEKDVMATPVEPKPSEPEPLATPTPPACETFGTRVEFVCNPTDAARLARQDNKLLFVLHISGNFEDDKFT